MFPLQDNVQSRSVPVVTWIIILLNGVAFLYELALPPEQLERFLMMVGMVPAWVESDPGSYWTLLTSMFFHGSWMHFIGNMWMLYLFGDNVEDRMGPVGYLLFYLVCGLAAGLTHLFTNPGSPLPTIGASGAIAGVLGAYFLLFPTARVVTLVLIVIFPLFLEVPAVVYLGVWFAMQLYSGTLSSISVQHIGGVAWWAHVGGFVAGMILLPFFKKSKEDYRDNYPDEYRAW